MNSYAVRRSHIAMSARLACLIHAANVHSEPGSNPSRCGEWNRDIATPLPSSPQSHSDLRILTGRGDPVATRAEARISRESPWFCESDATSLDGFDTTFATPTPHHAGFPQGFITNNDRPNCQRASASGASSRRTIVPRSDAIDRSCQPFGHHPGLIPPDIASCLEWPLAEL